MNEHECVFPEEQEPSGRLILAPCLTCGFSAMDALEQLRNEVEMWSATAKGAIRDMKHLADDFSANGNSCELGDPCAAIWHDAARTILDRLASDAAFTPTEVEEPEWEYAVAERDGRSRGQFGAPRDRASVEAWWAEQRDLQDRGCYLIRRRPAGPWGPVPVPAPSEEDDRG